MLNLMLLLLLLHRQKVAGECIRVDWTAGMDE